MQLCSHSLALIQHELVRLQEARNDQPGGKPILASLGRLSSMPELPVYGGREPADSSLWCRRLTIACWKSTPMNGTRIQRKQIVVPVQVSMAF